MLLLVVVSLARTSHQPASRTLPTCLQACLQAALQVQSAALQLSQPRPGCVQNVKSADGKPEPVPVPLGLAGRG